ncbi:MAG: hypothetical protein JKY44_01865 [Flavobacteriaceae bacterium]|nr:hypothetical protein [Flavobacteriaceae bacterium]
MKNVLLKVFFLLITVGLYAQQGINYKAVIKDAGGAVLSMQAITVQFQILQGASQTNVYQETHTTTTDANGIISINIGKGTPNSGDFTTVDWGVETFFNTQIDTGTGLVDIGTTGFKPVPFALQVETANNGIPTGGTEGQVLQISSGAAVWADATYFGTLLYRDVDGDGYGDVKAPIISVFASSGYVSNKTDCDDADASINPETVWYIDADADNYGVSTAVVSCSRPTDGFLLSELVGINDCDDTDPIVLNTNQTWYIDSDGDKYGLSVAVVSCLRPVNGFLASELLGINDCYDADANEYPNQTWYIDADADRYGLSNAIVSCFRPINGFLASELLGINDCEDTDANINPEIVWYIDADGDRYGLSGPLVSCTRPINGFLASELLGINDCEDTDANINPEIVWYIDADEDRYGLSTVVSCTRPINGFLASELLGISDCEDTDVNEYPGQTWYIDFDGDLYYSREISCTRPTNGMLLSEISPLGLEDCDDTDPLVLNVDQTWYIDVDADKYGLSIPVVSCTRPINGFLVSELLGINDCDDTDPGAINTDQFWYIDADGDRYGLSNAVVSCTRPINSFIASELLGTNDCVDTNENLNPAIAEIFGDGIDNNCNGQIDEAVIGQLRAGGVVFWVDSTDNNHGLVCTMSDYTNQVTWGCGATDLPSVPNVLYYGSGDVVGTGSEIGAGVTNTNAILNDCPNAPAALAARTYGPEWFLPSINELKKMHTNKALLEQVSGFSALKGFYWSSSEGGTYLTWILEVSGFERYSSKSESGYVRAVKAF